MGEVRLLIERALGQGGDAQHVTQRTKMPCASPDPADEILDLHDALDDLARIDARRARVVEMRYFGGMEDAEIAEVLNMPKRTVTRDWNMARPLLTHTL
jgi:DNA-directed RNA polymerase specialized sigma24 family protein